jgi:putative oxidoreductase
MTLVRRLARPLLAAAFIESGISSLRNPGPEADRIRPLFDQVSGPLHLPPDLELILRVDGALLIGAGGLLAMGRFPRLAAVALAAGAAPATYSDLVFWREKDPELRRRRRTEALTRLSVLGGVLLAAVDTSGRPGLLWRGRHAATHVQHSTADLAGDALRTAALTGRGVRRQAKQSAGQAKRAADQAKLSGRQAKLSGRQARKQADLAARAARARAAAAGKQAQRAVERTRRQATGAARSARQVLPV